MKSRPNVTIDVAGLALKTGNAAILRGGSETLRTNRALVAVIRQALAGSRPARQTPSSSSTTPTGPG